MNESETVMATWVDVNGNDFTTSQSDTDIIEWAIQATVAQMDQEIMAFDKDTNTIFAGSDAGEIFVVVYDDNDYFDVGTSGNEKPVRYAEFESSLAEGLNLDWGEISKRRRDINEFTLTLAAS